MKSAGAPDSIASISRTWIAITGFQVNFAFTVDHLTLIMLGVVTGVGFLIHLYSVGYMAHEEGYWRFFAYLNLFMFFMLVLVLLVSFLLIFVGWEGVGLASYLLIGFYFKKDSAANAGKKAFVVNRIGDFGFLLAMFLLIVALRLARLQPESSLPSAANPEWQGGTLTTIALLLVLGAAGKSAQIPLYVWLPDAMEGPTPVSALIHAATMVTAGIYMVARCHTLFDRSPFALTVVAIIGAATAIFAACIGMVQHDIKRVLAYSTVSQLGYMFLACGVGAYECRHLPPDDPRLLQGAALPRRRLRHPRALAASRTCARWAASRKRIPITFWTMTAGVFAIAGIPPFAGFFSKDEILFRAFTSRQPPRQTPLVRRPHHRRHDLLLHVPPLVQDLLRPRALRRARRPRRPRRPSPHALQHARRHGRRPDEEHATHSHGVHESPWIMLFPLVILAILSVIGGWVGIPIAFGGSDEAEHFLEPVFASGAAGRRQPRVLRVLTLAGISILTAFLGFYIAYLFYYKKPRTAAALAAKYPALYRLVANKFYVDEIYTCRPRHAAADVHPHHPRRPRRPRHRQRLRLLSPPQPPAASASSPAAFSPETSAPTPAGWRSEPPPFSSS